MVTYLKRDIGNYISTKKKWRGTSAEVDYDLIDGAGNFISRYWDLQRRIYRTIKGIAKGHPDEEDIKNAMLKCKKNILQTLLINILFLHIIRVKKEKRRSS